MPRQKIVFVTLEAAGHATTGGMRYDREVMEYLARAGLSVEVAEDGSLVSRSHVLSNFRMVLRLFPHVGPGSTVVVNSYLHSRVLLVTLFLKVFKSARIVTICHHLTFHDLRSGLVQKLDKPLEGWFLRLSDKVITVSRSTMEEIRSLGVAAEKIAVIPDGMDSRVLPTRRKSENADLRLIFVGTCNERKGLMYLLRALSLLKGHGIKLSIVGDMDDDPAYSQMLFDFVRDAALEGDVTFHGWVPERELWLMYSRADVFVLPSLWEGYGIVLMEAMSFGLPIVASDAGAIPELVTSGENGILVAPKDSVGLADAILRLARDPRLRAKLGEGGRRTASGFISWEDVGRKFYSALQSI